MFNLAVCPVMSFIRIIIVINNHYGAVLCVIRLHYILTTLHYYIQGNFRGRKLSRELVNNTAFYILSTHRRDA